MGDLWDAFRKILIGYTPEEAEKVRENLEEANKRVEENKEANGGEYSFVDSIFPQGDMIVTLLMVLVGLVLFKFITD